MPPDFRESTSELSIRVGFTVGIAGRQFTAKLHVQLSAARVAREWMPSVAAGQLQLPWLKNMETPNYHA